MKFRDIGPYRFFFTATIATNRRTFTKFWLEPVRLAKSSRFAAHELRKMERIIRKHHSGIVEAWNEFLRR